MLNRAAQNPLQEWMWTCDVLEYLWHICWAVALANRCRTLALAPLAHGELDRVLSCQLRGLGWSAVVHVASAELSSMVISALSCR